MHNFTSRVHYLANMYAYEKAFFFSLSRIVYNFIERSGDQNKIPSLENGAHLNYLWNWKIIEKDQTVLLIEILSFWWWVQIPQIYYLPYILQTQRPKGKNVFQNSTTISYIILEMVEFLVMYSREKKADKSYQQKQLRNNFKTLLRTYFCIYKATLQVHPPKLVTVHTYLYAPTHFRFKKN